MTIPTPASPAEEAGWLIELKASVPTWWSLGCEDDDYEPGWENDANKALRFARKCDAEAYINDMGWTDTFASEHLWLPSRNAAQNASLDVEHPFWSMQAGIEGAPSPDPIAQAVREAVEKEREAIERLTRENEHLRASTANNGGPCLYCTLPKAEWSKCVNGFPGCDRADDAMLCPNVGASLEAEATIERLTKELAEARSDAQDDAVVQRIMDMPNEEILRLTPKSELDASALAGELALAKALLTVEKRRAEAAEASASALRERVKRLEEAAAPFVRGYAPWMDEYPDETDGTYSRTNFGEMRRLRALLKGGANG